MSPAKNRRDYTVVDNFWKILCVSNKSPSSKATEIRWKHAFGLCQHTLTWFCCHPFSMCCYWPIMQNVILFVVTQITCQQDFEVYCTILTKCSVTSHNLSTYVNFAEQ